MSDESVKNEFFSSSQPPEEVKAEYAGRVPPQNDFNQGNGYHYQDKPGEGMNGQYRYQNDPNGANRANGTPGGYRPVYTASQQNRPQQKPKPPKEKIKAEISDIIALVFTIVTVFASAYACFTVHNGIITAAIQTAFLIFVTATIRKKNKASAKSTIFPGIIAFLTAISNCLTPEMSFIKLVFSYYVFSIYGLSLTGAKGYPLKDFVNIFHQIRAFLFIPVRKIFLPAASIFRNIKLIPIVQLLGVAGGIILGIPFLIITALLLTNADMAFNNVVSDLISNLEGWFSEIFNLGNFGVILTSAIAIPLLYSFIFSAKHGVIRDTLGDNKSENAVIKLGFVHSSVLLGFYGVISICYVTYIFSQFRYLFSGFSGILPEGTQYTLSQYARQGFFEMSGVALLNLILITLGSVFAKRKDKTKLPKTYRIFSAFFCIFTLLITATAISKMVLYVSELGFTEKRILVLIADVILLVTFISILLKLFIKKFPCIQIISYFALSVICIYCVAGTDALIAEFNTEMYISKNHESIHLDTINEITDGYLLVTNLDKLVNTSDEAVATNAKAGIYYLYQDRTSQTGNKTFSVSDLLCASFINKNSERIKGYREFCYDLSEDKIISYDVRYDNSFRLYELTLYVSVPDRFVSFELSNDMISTVCKTDDGKPFGEGAKILISHWFLPEDSDTVATVKATDKDGKNYTFAIKTGEETIIDEEENFICTSDAYDFEGLITYKDNDLLIYR